MFYPYDLFFDNVTEQSVAPQIMATRAPVCNQVLQKNSAVPFSINPTRSSDPLTWLFLGTRVAELIFNP
jgi:hypothetical protein